MEWESYERSLKDLRDAKGYIDTALEDGEKRGMIKVAKSAKLIGLYTQDISKLPRLSEDEINKL